jgi:hypothetical protein
MVPPPVLPGMEEWNNLSGSGVRGSDIASFVTVAKHTGKSQVAQTSGAAVLAGKNMIHLMTDVAVLLVDQAVLTPSPSPAADLLPDSVGSS